MPDEESPRAEPSVAAASLQPLQATPPTRPTNPAQWAVGGAWTWRGLGALAQTPVAAVSPTLIDGAGLLALDSAGAWVLRRWMGDAAAAGPAAATLRAWPARAQGLMAQMPATAAQPLRQPPHRGLFQRSGRQAVAAWQQGLSFLAFVGQLARVALAAVRHPARMRWRVVLREIEIGGFDALGIIGLTSFLLGVVVAYQGADQLRHYGANVFVVELVGYAMLREFAPLIGAIIIAGRSGSAYAAQIGTMVVNEEIDAMRTLAIDPQERLVLPKVFALAIALPLLTVFADITGVFGGMVMARSQLDIGFAEFARRFGSVMQGSAFLLGVGKSLVFAFIIVGVGCFQGFRTAGSADSVGRQTTLAVVQAIFLVIVADALFSVFFNLLGL
jgi:phospholipid/cholesterol/gamma-HCH transport system permease protein